MNKSLRLSPLAHSEWPLTMTPPCGRETALVEGEIVENNVGLMKRTLNAFVSFKF